MTRALDWSQSSDVLLCHADLQQCGASAAAAAVAKNSRKILDITHTLREDLPIWLGEDGLGRITAPVLSMSRGDDANVSELKLDSVHTGTHVDAPGHYVQEFYEEGLDVALLDLNILVGKE
jgi:kynurenine formamidase